MVLDQTTIILEYTGATIIFVGFLVEVGMLFILSINEVLSRLAIYHSPKTQNNVNGEPFLLKVWNVLITYVFLSLFFFVAILVTMRFSGITNLDGSVISSEIGTIFLLIVIRWLLNPTETASLQRSYPKEKAKDAIKIFKERIVSLFLSYICITWIIFVLYLIVNIAGGVSFQTSINYFVPNDLFQPGSLLMLFISYSVSLIFLTLITEAALRWFVPIDQTPWETTKKN